MRIRTVYFKVPEMETARAFWSHVLGVEPKPHKDSPAWTEFQAGTINFGLTTMDADWPNEDRGNCLPVFECSDSEFDGVVARARGGGAKVLVDIAAHPDGQSYVLRDPFGNEFEVTRLHD